MGVKEVSYKAIRQNPVTYKDSTLQDRQDYMKLINYDLSVAKAKGRFNRIGLVTHDSPISVGDIVTVDDDLYVVASRVPDVYRGTVVRYVCELYFCDTRVKVVRRTLQKDQFDVITGSTETTVWDELPVTWEVSDMFVKGVRGLESDYFNVVFSVHYHNISPIKIEDTVEYYGDSYEFKFFRRDLPGVVMARAMIRSA